MSTINNTKFYSVVELAEALGLTPSRIRQRIIAHEIVAEKPGRDHLIPESEYKKQLRLLSKNGRSNRGRPRKS